MVEGLLVRTKEGTPQGGPLSPLLANIYLDGLDEELAKRGLAFCRYADDCNIYVGSQQAAKRVLESVSRWISRHLKLEVNATKSGTGRPWERKFLGFRIKSARSDRSCLPECGTFEGPSAGDMAKLPESKQ